MPPAGRFCQAQVSLCMLSLIVITMEQDMPGGISILSSPLGQTRLQWTLWLTTLATPQVSPIMLTLSKVQQQQQLASRNATHSSGTRTRVLLECVRGLTFFALALESYGYQALVYNRHIALAFASTGALT
jgi:hypothetical protein